MTYSFGSLLSNHPARVAGFMFLFVLATYLVGDFVFLSELIVWGDITETARRITADQTQYRFGTLLHLICTIGTLVLIVALYILLRPVDKNIALLGLLWRLGEVILGGIIALSDFVVMSLVGSKNYLNDFTQGQIDVLVNIFVTAHYDTLRIAIVFSTMGAMSFYYVFLKSTYIPKIFSISGILAALTALSITLFTFIAPDMGAAIQLGYLPIFIFEISLGLWLLFKGINIEPKTIN